MGFTNKRTTQGDIICKIFVNKTLCEKIGANAAYKDLYRNTESLPLDQGLAYEADTAYDIADTNERLEAFLAR